ncbi:hypothetical protein [Actinomycetospora chibensis]|uniref:Uncharacterized protein n=1 Tax=Actinomycetospora chibensis TaxID=663606 RepID=A0ABV9RSZ4_9PSEU|nr:hypothetical protein [Actinomycetospora chibensis]MDD7927257.1 hypothetical protein [Actinomycetospora chibensis]
MWPTGTTRTAITRRPVPLATTRRAGTVPYDDDCGMATPADITPLDRPDPRADPRGHVARAVTREGLRRGA